MLSDKKIMQESASFFTKQVDKILVKINKAKTPKTRQKYINQMIALRNRVALEIKMMEQSEDF